MLWRRKGFMARLMFLGLLLLFGAAMEGQALDNITWKGKVLDIQGPPEGGGPGGPPEEPPPLPGAQIRLVSNPGISATSGGSDGCSLDPGDPAYAADCGIFTLAGIPANQLHWIKVTKTGYVPTNIGIQFKDTNADSSQCGPGGGACTFQEELFCVSEQMITAIQQRVPALTIQSGKAVVLVEIEGESGDLGIYDYANHQYLKQVAIYLNGSDIPLTPQQYVDMEPGRLFIIPNVTPGTATVRFEIEGLTVPVITVPAFADEITDRGIEIVDTANQGTITGTVTATGGGPLSGATVSAMPGWGRSVSALTGSDGTYTLSVRADTNYRLEVRATGYAFQLYYQTDRWDWATQVSVPAQQTMTGKDFVLDSANKISGRVKAGSNPVQNVWVHAFSQTQQTNGGGNTDSSGNYTIWVKPASDYKVQVQSQNYAPQFYNNKSGMMEADYVDVSNGSKACEAGDRSDCIDFNLVSGKSISGRITKASDGTGIPNLWVNAWSDAKGSNGGGNTDASGNYSITLAPASDYRVSVNSPNYPQAFYGGPGVTTTSWNAAVLIDVTNSNVTNIDIALSAGRSISGTVKNGQGSPLSNVEINAFSPNGFGHATSGQDGTFTAQVPPGSGYRVEAWSSEYPRVMWKGTITNGAGTNDSTISKFEEATEINTTSQDITGLDFTMSAGITVSGSVIAGGSPLAGAWVNAHSDGAGAWGGGNTDGQGNFSFKVPGGIGYKINVNHADYPMVFYKLGQGGTVSSCATNCSPDGTTQKWDEATVFDFADGGTSGVNLASTGAGGVNLTLSSGGSIAGTVTANGVPVVGVWINAMSDGFGAGEPTNAQGQYRVRIPIGSYRVEVFHPQYVRQFYNAKYDWMDADLVEVTAENLSRTNINFNLSSGNTVSGRVTFNGSGVSNIWVNAHSETQTSGGGASTDSQGNYRISLRPASDYRVGVWHPDYVPQMYNNKSDWMQADLVDVSSGSATNINFALSQGVEITGTVLANGSPPEADQWGNRGWINAHSDKTGSHAGGPIQSNGTYSLKVNAASDYRVEASHPNYARQFYNGTAKWDEATLIDTTSGSRSNINFTLSSGRTITGTIIDENNLPKANIWVNAFSEANWVGGGEKTASDGTYTIRGLAAGAGYRVSIWSNDQSSNYANVFYKDGVEAGTSDWMQATLVDLTSANATNISIKLSQGRSIAGTVSVASGALSGNIWVDAFSETLKVGRGEQVRYSSGAASATYTIRGLPAANDYRVHTFADSYGNLFYDGTNDWMQATLVDLTSGNATGKDFTLTSGASIAGTIYQTSVDAANVVRHGWVQAMNPEAGSFQGSPVQQDGTYRINGLVAGTRYTVQAMTPEYMAMFYNGDTSSAAWVEPNVTATESGTTGIDIVLSSGYVISGRVFAADGSTPVAGAFIGVFGSDSDNGNLDNNPFFWSPMTDSAGNYRTPPLSAGDYLIGAMHPDHGKVLYESGGSPVITLSADQTNIDITFAASSDLRTITGTVTNSTGNTFNEVQVLAYKCTDDTCTTNAKVKGTTSRTEKDGGGSITSASTVTYTIEKLEPGEYKIRFIGLPEPPNAPAMAWYGGGSKANATKVNVSAVSATNINGTPQ